MNNMILSIQLYSLNLVKKIGRGIGAVFACLFPAEHFTFEAKHALSPGNGKGKYRHVSYSVI